MTIDYIRKHYGVPAALNGRVIAIGKPGRIVGTDGPHLLILTDGDTEPGKYHPTWKVEYLADAGEAEEARAQVAELADQLHKANAQIHSLEKATTAYANENAQLKRELESSRSISRSNARNFNTLAEVIERVSKFADEMETYCSPHGVATTYAKRLREVINAPTSNEAEVA